MPKICKLALLAGAIVVAFASTDVASAQSTGGWAVVAPDGTLGNNKNVKSVDHVSAGVYQVNFNNAVGVCAADATIAGRGKKSTTPGYIVVNHGKDGSSIVVHTFLTTTLLPSDFRFHLITMC